MTIKKLLFLLIFTGISLSQISWDEKTNTDFSVKPAILVEDYIADFYKELNIKDLNFQAFNHALGAYLKLSSEDQLNNKKFLTIIDMSQSSDNQRFFLIDIEKKELVHKSIVAHGRNTGSHQAKYFSNEVGSYKSSIGFFKTAETYFGKHGLSLRLDGLEYSNDNARKRAIVIHAADYVSYGFIKKFGRLGRSLGCPSLPKENYKKVIDNIKNGSLLYIYYPNKDYLTKSILANHSHQISNETWASVSSQ